VYGLYLEHTAIVNITIRASPQPKIEWTIDGAIVGQGRTDGRYSAYEPQYMGNDEYNVTLAIAGLTLEDTTKTYNLRASNELGLTDYQVRISSSSKTYLPPPTDKTKVRQTNKRASRKRSSFAQTLNAQLRKLLKCLNWQIENAKIKKNRMGSNCS